MPLHNLQGRMENMKICLSIKYYEENGSYFQWNNSGYGRQKKHYFFMNN